MRWAALGVVVSLLVCHEACAKKPAGAVPRPGWNG
jgi:hypothetical protein